MRQPLLLVPFLGFLPALELVAAGPPHGNDSAPVIRRVHNKFSAVKNISRRDVACPPDKYSSGENCCDLCEPGYVVEKDCTSSTKTICKICREGEEYMDLHNYRTKCSRCSSCDPEHGLEVDKPCIISQNVQCRCKQGFFCNSSEQCHHCDPCTKCEDGIVIEKCTPTNDTICERKQNLLRGIGIGIGVVLLVFIVILFIIWYKKYRMPKEQTEDEQKTMEMKQLRCKEKYPDIDLTPHISDIVELMTLAQVKQFVRKQGLSNPTMEKIELENMHDTSEKKIKLLDTWYQEKGIKGAYETLICGLKGLKLHTIADKIVQKMSPCTQNNASAHPNTTDVV